MFHAGWIVCPYVVSGYCGTDGLLAMDAKKGGTNRLSRHLARHEKQSNTRQICTKDLGERCRRNITDAAALAAILDNRPLGFTDNHPGIAAFATEVFKAGQSVPVGIDINPKSYLPSRGAVSDAITRLVANMRKNFIDVLKARIGGYGGAVTVDGVTLKIQGKHYYDFTVHYMAVRKAAGILATPTFGIETSTILFLEGPEVGNAENIRSLLDVNLQKEYGLDFNTIQKSFSMVTDGAAVMAKMAGSSVSLNKAIPDESWMRCFVHMLHNCMKAVMEDIASDDVMKEIVKDFVTMKKIVTNSKKATWNSKLPMGYHLIQEVETRFGTHYIVAERFLKSKKKVWDLIVSQTYKDAIKLYKSLVTDGDDELVAILAITDAFKPIYDATVEFGTAHQPCLHKVLPTLQYFRDELSKIERGEQVLRSNNCAVSPSPYSMRLCAAMKAEICKIEVHDLWLVSCFLYPYLRNFDFWKDSAEREIFKIRAEALTRALYEQEVAKIPAETSNLGAIQNGTSSNPNHASPFKKAKFSLIDYVPNDNGDRVTQDEVSRYKNRPISEMGLNRIQFSNDAFAGVKFWYARKGTYPHLYKVAMRVYATPASSSSSERVFSRLKNIVTAQRSHLSAEHLSDLIVGHSLHLYNN